VSIERNVSFVPAAVTVAADVLNVGEMAPPVVPVVPSTTSTVQNVSQPAPIKKPPSTPPRIPQQLSTLPTPRPTRIWPPPGFYKALNEGQRASVAVANLLDESELDLIDEESLTCQSSPTSSTSPIHSALAAAEPEPTLQQALNGPDAIEWQEAIDYEISQLEKLNAWEIVDPPLHGNIIPCHYVLVTKHGPSGEKLKLCARLVANGQRQQYRLDYSEMFAPTSSMSTIRTVLTVAAQRDWEIDQVDIKSAYLHAKVKEVIYMRPPPGYLRPEDKGKVLKLLRSLYGLKQAGFEWSEELVKVFLEIGFTRSQVDQVVYYKKSLDEHMVITVSVDDMAVTSKHLTHIKHFKSQLRKYFEISDLGELSWLLGLKVEQD
jgi:hypothetical protein